MTIRKRISGKGRLYALCYGSASIAIALLIAQYATFEWSSAIAFILGLFGVGGVYRSLVGYDEI